MDHVHHRLMRSGLSERAAASRLHVAGLALVVVGILSSIHQSRALGIYVVAFVLASFFIVKHVARAELLESGTAIVNGLTRPSNKVLAVILYPLLDALVLVLALGAALAMTRQPDPSVRFERLWTDQMPLPR